MYTVRETPSGYAVMGPDGFCRGFFDDPASAILHCEDLNYELMNAQENLN